MEQNTMYKVKEWVIKNSQKTLSEILHMEPFWYTRERIENLGLSVRANNVLSNYLDPPLSAPNGVHFTLDELLNITTGDLWNIHNLTSKEFVEILLNLYQLADKEKISEFEPIIDAGMNMEKDSKH